MDTYKGTKLLASHFGGTRNPMAVRWSAKIKPDAAPRTQFHHVNDVVPAIYEILGITPPRTVNGVEQDPIDGVSFAYSLSEAKAEGRLRTQYFEIMGSRAIYHDGWLACVLGPRIPWLPGLPPGIREWTPDKDVWELYNLEQDWSQATDLASRMPEKLAQMREIFLIEAVKNKALPIGRALWVPMLHPELRIAPPYTEWTFSGDTVRMPEFCAPALGNRPNVVTIDAVIPPVPMECSTSWERIPAALLASSKTASFTTNTTSSSFSAKKIRAAEKLSAGRMKIEIETRYVEPRLGDPLKVTMKVAGKVVAEGTVPVSAPLAFTANDCLDIGIALGSPVSLDYYDKAPFRFNGTVEQVHVRYLVAP